MDLGEGEEIKWLRRIKKHERKKMAGNMETGRRVFCRSNGVRKHKMIRCCVTWLAGGYNYSWHVNYRSRRDFIWSLHHLKVFFSKHIAMPM